jgi:hypothetical protein
MDGLPTHFKSFEFVVPDKHTQTFNIGSVIKSATIAPHDFSSAAALAGLARQLRDEKHQSLTDLQKGRYMMLQIKEGPENDWELYKQEQIGGGEPEWVKTGLERAIGYVSVPPLKPELSNAELRLQEIREFGRGYFL